MIAVSRSKSSLRWGLTIAGGAVVLYALIVLMVAATAPDLRLRWLLVDAEPRGIGRDQRPTGLLIRQTEGVRGLDPLPQTGDLLLTIADEPVGPSILAAQRILNDIPPPGVLWSWSATRTPRAEALLVPVTYLRPGETAPIRTSVEVQAVPSFEIGLTVVWFLCQLTVLGLGMLAFWKRPFDRPVRLFVAMCIVTLGAFVGGFHWWLLSGSFFLTLPFVVCALLVPSVTLHFFLVYPHPKEVITRRRAATLWGIYGPPVLASVGFLGLESVIWASLTTPQEAATMNAAWTGLRVLRGGIYLYLLVAATYFLATLVSLIHSVLTTRPVLERRQVTFILYAGMLASLCIGYTLVLAGWDHVSFALGGARLPMFLSSLVFMVAYAVGIVRYKLMLTDEGASRELLLEATRLAGAVGLGLVTVSLALLVGRRMTGLPWMPTLAVGVVLLVISVVALAARDRWQRWMERRVFRERFRLERALQRIQRAVGQLADPQYLSERTLAACCEVLQAEWAGLYLRDGDGSGTYRLSGTQGAIVELPLAWSPTPEFLQALEREAGVVSLEGDPRTQTTSLVAGLNALGGELVHRFEIDGEPAGLVILGPKPGGGVYTSEDGTFLTALTQLTGVALHCVRVHQDLTQLNEQLRMKVERIAQQKQQILLLQAELAASRPEPAIPNEQEFRRGGISGSGPGIARVLETARKAAASEATVLIRGESGTGKELLARAMHDNSPRRHGPLVTVHCAALAPGLLESELFGHVKGAFTGATADRRGRFEAASGGTLFLDEVGEISLETQVKLLRVLQQREIEPVGSGAPVAVDVRLVAATHRPLEQMIADGRFREDLYYRLNVITLELPALRERREDLHELAVEFLKRTAVKCGKRVVDFEEGALDALLRYSWPGNIRELENVVERAVVLSDGELVALRDLPGDLTNASALNPRPSRDQVATRGRSAAGAGATPASWKRPPASDDESARLVEALEAAGGNKARAAQLLGLPRSTFFSKLKKHGIQA